ncbi:MAG: 3-oxoadipate enol-lactonase [Desulfobacterota bacterium]|jgi:3-oxoadipate enol-lactonase|nr:3-oxoadipate enol-lactonase [Thermodesulfobacteriota bacterium]
MLINANGILLNYELTGKEGAPMVVLSHSLGSSLVMWEPQLSALEPRFRVLRYDTRGHGGSEAVPGPYTFEMLAADAVALLDELGIPRVHFIGLSMGGMIGQALGIYHPERLVSLTLCDTAAANPPGAREIWQERIDLVRRQGLAPLWAGTLDRWLSPEFVRRNPPLLEKIRRQFLATSVNGYGGCSQAIMGLDYLGQLGRIKTPTLIIVGEEDQGTPVSAARALQDRISGSRLVMLPQARHLSSVEQTEHFNRAVLEFLTTLSEI